MTYALKLATSALTVIFATGAFAAVDRIKEIDVTADLSAVSNETAALYWSTLEVDLEAAIAARLTDRFADEGARIRVDLREVELTNAFDRAINLGEAVLVGQVNIEDDTDNQNSDAYELTVSLETARVLVPEGGTIVITADDKATYQSLVDAFADGVVERLK
jgi:hypothetical protein